ncbi:MAG: glucuronate isomerase, partial [Planctomycetaceae bacterium]
HRRLKFLHRHHFPPFNALRPMPSRPFIHDNFLLGTRQARELYHRYAADEPIYDYHCHLPPDQIASNHPFADLAELWLGGDHYKWRAMRTNGVKEQFITGSASPREKFQAWAETVPHTLRNPLFHWTHLELRRHFGIDDLLDGTTAESVWVEANRQLATGPLTARGILLKMNVSLVGTTDDPADPLDWHAAIAAAGFPVRVVPTFRPDAAGKVHQPEKVKAWARRLAEVSGRGVDTYQGLLAALAGRHEDFARAGCRASDHGLDRLAPEQLSDSQAAAIWQRAMAGTPATPDEADGFATSIALHVARLNHARGFVTQLHVGAFRDPNQLLARRLGADAGCDTIGDLPQGLGLVRFLGRLSGENALGRTILYNINPADNALFAALPGSFQDGVIPGKMQWGSGWWFMDQERGMRDQMNMLSDLGLLARFVGMVTDSRSFLSYPRHEYFRRILCDLLGSDVASGRLPDRRDWLDEVVAGVCHGNAHAMFIAPVSG